MVVGRDLLFLSHYFAVVDPVLRFSLKHTHVAIAVVRNDGEGPSCIFCESSKPALFSGFMEQPILAETDEEIVFKTGEFFPVPHQGPCLVGPHLLDEVFEEMKANLLSPGCDLIRRNLFIFHDIPPQGARFEMNRQRYSVITDHVEVLGFTQFLFILIPHRHVQRLIKIKHRVGGVGNLFFFCCHI